MNVPTTHPTRAIRADAIVRLLDAIAGSLDCIEEKIGMLPTRSGIYTSTGAARVMAYAAAIGGVGLVVVILNAAWV